MTVKLKEEYHSKYKFIDTIVKRGGWLALNSKNYRYREEQVKMIDTILDGIEEKKHIVVEAPTGTGKSFAYLLAGINEVLKNNKRIAVCTNTINLQEQLIESDLPFLAELFNRQKNIKLNYKLLKGKGNYVCEHKIKEFEKDGIEAESKEKVDYIKEAIRWSKSTKTGDRSEAPTNVLKVWDEIRADQYCPKSCTSDCSFKKARLIASKSDIVVLNHHTYIMDYMLKEKTGKGFLNNFDLVIFDEGHHIEKIVIEAFGYQTSYYSTITRINSSIKVLKKERTKNIKGQKAINASINYFEKVKEKMELFWDYIKEEIKNHKKDKITLRTDRRILKKKYLVLMKKLYEKLGKIYGSLFNDSIVILSVKTLEKLEKNKAYLEANFRNYLLIVERQMKKEYAYWIENEENPTLIAKPIDISEKLENLFDNKNIISPTNIVFTSATITTNKEFKFFIKNLGLPNNTKTTTVKSPFNYKEQARLYIPENSLSGTIATQNPDKYREYISKNIKKVAGITQRGIFALFTSYSAMEGTYEKIKNDLPFHNLLLQGNMNKNILLERFKKEKNSILFATYSFWEGVDVKGDDLGYVFIDKIPFEVHTDPLIVAKKNKMNDNGDNFFNDYYVPEAIIKLKQGFGRLIRTKLDYGAVIILDDRIIPGTKGYSKKIYNSFPDIDEIFTRDFKEVEALEKRKRKVVSISSIS
jgi:ATP-dependent DNA helicase DinG